MSHRVLILEDDPDFRELLEECLEDADYDVVAAGSGDEAVQACRQQVPDLIVADVRMKHRDGIETIRLLKGDYPSLKAIIITGYADEDAPSRAIQVEAEDYIYKPFALADLLESIHRVLSRAQERGRYRGLLDSLGRGFKRLKDKATTAMVDKELKRLDLFRDKVFLGFYVALRAEMLIKEAGRTLWSKLVELERRREKLLGQSLALNEMRELCEEYSYLADLMAAAGSSSMAMNPSFRDSPRLIPSADYACLRDNISAGKLSSEQLKLAPFLYTLDPVVRDQSPELTELYQAAWGAQAAR